MVLPAAACSGAAAQDSTPRVELGVELPEVADAELARGDDAVAVELDSQRELDEEVVVHVCATPDGQPFSVVMTNRTGEAAVDEAVVGEVMQWQYEPYAVDGEAVGFCEWRDLRVTTRDGELAIAPSRLPAAGNKLTFDGPLQEPIATTAWR